MVTTPPPPPGLTIEKAMATKTMITIIVLVLANSSVRGGKVEGQGGEEGRGRGEERRGRGEEGRGRGEDGKKVRDMEKKQCQKDDKQFFLSFLLLAPIKQMVKQKSRNTVPYRNSNQ